MWSDFGGGSPGRKRFKQNFHSRAKSSPEIQLNIKANKFGACQLISENLKMITTSFFLFHLLCSNLLRFFVGSKRALSLLLILELFIILFLFSLMLCWSETSLLLFRVSFSVITLAVLAATLGLCVVVRIRSATQGGDSLVLATN